MNLSMKQKSENRLVIAQEAGGGMDWESGISRCKISHTEWINNRILLYSTENYIQYFVISHNGKKIKKKVYIYASLSHFAVQQTLTLYNNYIQLKFF